MVRDSLTVLQLHFSNSGRRELTAIGRDLVAEEIERFFKDTKHSVKEEIMAYVIEILKMDHLVRNLVYCFI